MSRSIQYRINTPISTDQFIALLQNTSLGERRPLGNEQTVRKMLKNANLTVTAWDGDTLVGIARSFTDYGYVAYVSDLAIDEAYQKNGIGTELLRHIQNQTEADCKIVLFAAPAAVDYYPKIGFESNKNGWVLNKKL